MGYRFGSFHFIVSVTRDSQSCRMPPNLQPKISWSFIQVLHVFELLSKLCDRLGGASIMNLRIIRDVEAA